MCLSGLPRGPASARAGGFGLVLAALLLAGCVAPAIMHAASAGTNLMDVSGGLAAPVKALEVRLAEARTNLAAFSDLGDAAVTNAPAGVPRRDLLERRTLLQRLVRLYEQQLSDVAELETTKARKAEIIHETQTWTRFEEPAPYSILFTDRLREELPE